MKRVDFDKLEVLDQVKYINKSLLEGYTLTNLCKDIGIGRSTVRDRFKRVGYEYNKSTNNYESIVEVVGEVGPNETILSEQGPTKLESSKKVVATDREILTQDREILTHMINNYSDNMNKLNELYSWYLESSKKVVATEKLNISDFEGDLVTRSYKLYEPIQKDFAEFCKKNNKYKVGDIITYKSNKSYITHRIVYVNKNKIVTKGDSNNTNDNFINKKDVVGKLFLKLRVISFISFIFTIPYTWIFIFIVGVIYIWFFSKYKVKNKRIIDKEVL